MTPAQRKARSRALILGAQRGNLELALVELSSRPPDLARVRMFIELALATMPRS